MLDFEVNTEQAEVHKIILKKQVGLVADLKALEDESVDT
jgi:hypothetical protein